MTRPARRTPATPAAPLFGWLLLALGVSTFTVAWVALGFSSGRQHSWMAVLGALDVALMLRLGHWRPARVRVPAAVLATALIIALANWGQIAAQLGKMLGYAPWESAVRLGFHHAWTLAQLANGAADIAWWLLAMAAAALASR
ncbi:hypothetical protein N799_02925 [Lysobacter arseniciresistens ZS79]|uniref:Uncharacterized protein n=1 Tax=Lysobacter arseniciresistens ZS79 TaxID=913325 RepID=A0A0A0F294_9GAMM|nr:hypothetical protein [Lysobacter arseniciresistens]KGM56680.1 hypothetical protein N799_02925 [Lysobacter arseniciresistens ZS79]